MKMNELRTFVWFGIFLFLGTVNAEKCLQYKTRRANESSAGFEIRVFRTNLITGSAHESVWKPDFILECLDNHKSYCCGSFSERQCCSWYEAHLDSSNREESRLTNSLFDDDEDIDLPDTIPRKAATTTTTTSTTRKPYDLRSRFTYTTVNHANTYTPYYKRWQTWLIVKLSLIMLFVCCRLCLCCCEAAADDTVVLMANRSNDHEGNNRRVDTVITISNAVDRKPPTYEAPPPYASLEMKTADAPQKY